MDYSQTKLTNNRLKASDIISPTVLDTLLSGVRNFGKVIQTNGNVTFTGLVHMREMECINCSTRSILASDVVFCYSCGSHGFTKVIKGVDNLQLIKCGYCGTSDCGANKGCGAKQYKQG